MSKDIQMFEISDKNQVVGTQIFDPSLPSNIDFEEKEENQHENTFINPEKKVPEMGKTLVIGTDLKEFRVKGNAMFRPQPLYHIGTPLPLSAQTHPVHLFGQESKGIKGIWDAIVGYSKREMMIQDGHVYFMARRGNGLIVDSLVRLWDLFTVFVDPEDEKIRLVLNIQHRLVNIDIQPDNFIMIMGMLNHELGIIGLSLSQ